MLRFRTLLTCLMVIVGLPLCYSPRAASARPQYHKVYKEVYPDADAATKCAICHIGRTDKKTRNDYGKLLEAELTGRNVKDVEEIKAALKKIGPAPQPAPVSDFP